MENLVNMIEGILEKSNRIQQGFLDRIEANDLRLSRIEGRIQSIENGIKDLYANQSNVLNEIQDIHGCLLYTSPSPRDRTRSRMPSSA